MFPLNVCILKILNTLKKKSSIVVNWDLGISANLPYMKLQKLL